MRTFICVLDSDAKRLLVLYSNSCCLSFSTMRSATILLLCTDLCHTASKFSPNVKGIAPAISQEKSNCKCHMIHVLFVRTWENEWSVYVGEKRNIQKESFKLSYSCSLHSAPYIEALDTTSRHSKTIFCLFVCTKCFQHKAF